MSGLDGKPNMLFIYILFVVTGKKKYECGRGEIKILLFKMVWSSLQLINITDSIDLKVHFITKKVTKTMLQKDPFASPV